MAKQVTETSSALQFANFDLDSRLLRALAKLGFEKPTLVQAAAVPLALKGKDILARARTGSGKTAAYCLPVVQKILVKKESIPTDAPDRAATRALILVPTRELAEQVTAHMQSLLSYCANDIKVTNIAANVPVQLQKPLLAELPDIVIATPARALTHLSSGSLSLTHLQSLVVDEADLVLSYGYEDDVKTIVTSHLPKIYQSFLMSATLTKDVEGLKGLILKSPAILKLEEEKDEPDLLTQYSVVTSEQDKFLLTYVILKLHLIRGKILIFVNDIDRCYRLKLLLEQFSIRSCVLNSELPLNSRYHIVEQFNKGIYDYLIATDEASLKGVTDSESESSDSEHSEDEGEETEKPKKKTKEDESIKDEKIASKGKKRRRQQDKEYGVSRGVDFQGVACVLNFDFPTSARAYTHRVGRTARGGQRGMALSFIVPGTESSQKSDVSLPSNAPKMKVPTFHIQSKDEKVVMRVEKLMKEDRGITEDDEASNVIKPYAFDMKQVEGFRYRMEDAMRAVTRPAIREARIKELKSEILNSEKLKAHFEDKPRDLAFLRHDRTLHPTRVQPHLKHIPTYMMPKLSAPKPSGGSEAGIGKVSFRSKSRKAVGGKRKKGDPLKTFSFSGNEGKKKRKRT